MAGVMNELDTNKQAWIKPELTAILISLEKKLERKILKDIDDDFEKRLKVVRLDTKMDGINVKDTVDPNEESLKVFMRDCLGLIKCLQYQGDINFDTNDFHRRILERISQNFENKAEIMHEYSNTLIKVIQISWNSKAQWE